MYQQHARINREYYMLKKYLGLTKPFDIIAFSMYKDEYDIDKKLEWSGFVQQIKDSQIYNSDQIKNVVKEVREE
jgi:hypothetical protein